MTDLEKFQKLFNECRIWRGGGHTIPPVGGGAVTYSFDIAVECQNGKTEYVELVAHFDDAGEWTRTTKQSRAKRGKNAKAR